MYAWDVHEYSLQPARSADARHLAQMSQQYVEAGLRPAWTEARINWHLRHPESMVLTARCGRTTAGFAIMRYGDDVAHLNLLAVDPEHRRKGVGRKIMLWLEDTALTAATYIIGLEMRATNQAAYAFYTALGYRELERVSGYYQGIEHAIRMSRDVRSSRDAVPGSARSVPRQ